MAKSKRNTKKESEFSARASPAEEKKVRPTISKKKGGSKAKETAKSKGTGKSKAASKSKKRSQDVLQQVPVELKKLEMKSAPIAFLLAHGAGGKSDSPQMIRYRDLLAKLGTVFQFDYPGLYDFQLTFFLAFQ
jgi:2,3-bisphosphoglycerate-independent phosphoglycerate mutase